MRAFRLRAQDDDPLDDDDEPQYAEDEDTEFAEVSCHQLRSHSLRMTEAKTLKPSKALDMSAAMCTRLRDILQCNHQLY